MFPRSAGFNIFNRSGNRSHVFWITISTQSEKNTNWWFATLNEALGDSFSLEFSQGG
jgi:hypothetical protein